MPDDDSAMTDAARDAVDAAVARALCAPLAPILIDGAPVEIKPSTAGRKSS